MDHLIELLKQAAGLMVVIVPLLKALSTSMRPRPKELEERTDRIRSFFDRGGPEQHPFLVEAAFGAAVGHLRLTAGEIPLLLKQKEPTNFLTRYLHVRQYLRPAADNSRFELKSLAASKLGAFLVRSVAFVFYIFFAGAAAWLLLQGVPLLVSQGYWFRAGGAMGLLVLFVAAAWFCLVEGRRVTWAIGLHRDQASR